MSVWVTGDVHGSIDAGKLSGRNWPEGRGLTRDDLVIVCGDFGMPWDGSNEECHWFDQLEDRLAFRDWYFGHYHADVRLDERHRLLYRDIVRVV